MRKFAVLTAVIAMGGGVSAASAADLSYKDTPTYEAAPAAIWSGLYVGGHIGGLWTNGGDFSKWRRWRCRKEELAPVVVDAVVEQKCNSDGYTDWEKDKYVKFDDGGDDVTVIGGVHVGYNWQSGSRVFGVEGDVDFADGLDYLASLRGRLGYARDNFLLYATAGVAFAGFNDNSVVMSYGDYFKKSFDFSGDSDVGFVVGGGVEYKLAPNWSVGVEGLYYGFSDAKSSKEWDSYCKQVKISDDQDNNLFVVQARVSYHFQDEAYEAPLK